MKGIAPVVLATAVGLGVVFSCLPATTKVEHLPPMRVVEAVASSTPAADLQQAVHSTFGLRLAQHEFGGASCTLVSRVRMEDGKYRYRALTAHHVLDTYLDAVTADPEADNETTLISLGWDEELEFTVQIQSDWILPIRDWASFTFVSERYLPCAVVGTRESFDALNITDDVYIIGNDNIMGLTVRKTTIGAPTHRMPTHVRSRFALSDHPWHSHSEDFFRMMSFLWYGCSGGGVYSSNGELIGVINAMGIFGGFHNDPTGFPAIALRAHVIRDLVIESNPGFFLIED